MDPIVASSGRAITIDRPRKARIRRDAVLHVLSSSRGQRQLLVVAALAGALGLALGGLSAGAALLALAAASQVAWWWLRTNASMRKGLDVGQTVRVDYASSGELSLTDATGQIWLRRGSVLAVVRYRGNVTVVGRQIAFLLPGELLTDADIAFLEGHGPVPAEVGVPGPNLPLSCEITTDLQPRLVAAATGLVLRSADFLTPWFSGVFVVGVIAYVGSARAVVVTIALYALVLLPGLRGVQRTRARVCSTYPIGLMVRASVTHEQCLLGLKHGTQTITWRDYSKVRITSDALMLRRARRPLAADRTLIVPRALFDSNALGVISTVISRRF